MGVESEVTNVRMREKNVDRQDKTDMGRVAVVAVKVSWWRDRIRKWITQQDKRGSIKKTGPSRVMMFLGRNIASWWHLARKDGPEEEEGVGVGVGMGEEGTA